MPEENIEGAFADLPEQKPEEKKSDGDDSKVKALLEEKERMAQEEREKRKQEAKKRAEVEAELEELKKAKPEIKEEKPEPQQNLQETVRKTLREETYRQTVVSLIKSVPGILKSQAEELLSAVEVLPKTDDPEADFKAASAYLEARKASQSGTPFIPNAGFGTSVSASPREASPSAVRLGKERYGLKDEDFHKYSGEIKL